MKTTLLATLSALFVCTTAQAEILNSNYDSRHQTMLEQASLNACGVNGGKLTQLSSSVVKHNVDQGIIDYYFTTELELTVRIDQGVYDTYKVSVNSMLADAYDHAAQDWGIYSVEAISCK
ncbi:MAG: hypothetical protein NDI63_05535 [Pseudobdellovibrio sp.]|nr:hypothetical protein [Pseudobdellovibrio sp.]